MFKKLTYFISNLNGGVNKLAIVTPVQCHAMVPKMFEEVWQDFVHDVLGFHTVGATALLYYLWIINNAVNLIIQTMKWNDVMSYTKSIPNSSASTSHPHKFRDDITEKKNAMLTYLLHLWLWSSLYWVRCILQIQIQSFSKWFDCLTKSKWNKYNTFNTIFFISSSGDWNSLIKISITSLV